MFTLLLLGCVPAGAQGGVDHSGTGGRHSIQGRILFPSGQRVDTRIKVKLESAGFGDLSILSDVNGTFSFRSLRPGSYESARKGENHKAVEQLNGALALHPDFALALSQLGVQYMKLKELGKASEALRSALKLMPDDYATLLTYGIVLFERQQSSEAEEQLRKALRKNSSSPSAHYYLGLILVKRNSYAEAQQEFESAVSSGGESMAMAHYYLGGLYWGKHEYKKAADSLETYLRLSPHAENAERVRATIKELRGKG
ncbi:MAG: tetratricopeptide repeat protein [Acidobacteria bacterium]|nr:tetratricopeptide repeat protein [Acidobacteriota bacterium]